MLKSYYADAVEVYKRRTEFEKAKDDTLRIKRKAQLRYKPTKSYSSQSQKIQGKK